MPTLFLTTPLPPRILTPAASNQAMRTRYTGTRTTMGMPRALSKAAMTRGNRVYPMMQILCAKELFRC